MSASRDGCLILAPPPLKQDGISELVRPVAVRVQGRERLAQRPIVKKRSEQLVVARARLVNPGKDGIDDAKASRGVDALGRQSFAGTYVAIESARTFEK